MATKLTNDEFGAVCTWSRDNYLLPMARAFDAAQDSYVGWHTLRKQYARELRSKKASELKTAVLTVEEHALGVRNHIGRLILETIKKEARQK